MSTQPPHDDADSSSVDLAASEQVSQPSRRTVLRSGAALSAAGLAFALATPAGAEPAGSVFAHGVASGDPMPDRVILWTRVTPTPDATPGSGIGVATSLTWEMSTGDDFAAIVASGQATATPDTDFTVKIDATGLQPNTRYHYRFRVTSGPATGAVSATGTTRSAPATGADVAKVRFGVVSCANWEAGHFAAYRHLAAQPNIDAIVHLGDYLYEYGTGEYGAKYDEIIRVTEPAHDIVTLQDYRIRHGQYKTDPDLAELHRRYPWICTWDDHESADDSWADGAENHQPNQGPWPVRKAMAAQAFYEWMPVRPTVDDTGRHLYRRLRYGTLLEISMLDLRSYRSEQVAMTDPQIEAAERTITGARQMSWLTNGVTSAQTTWKIIGNPVMITPVVIPPLDPTHTRALTDLLGVPSRGVPYNPDQWDGYTADRDRLLNAIRDNDVDNVVFITGDIHTSWACDVPVNAANYPGAGTVATELVGPSITSSNIDEMLGIPENTGGIGIAAALTAVNRHIRWTELDNHGYAVFTVTPAAAQMDWYFVRNKNVPNTGQYHANSYRVPAGVARVQHVGGPVN